MHVQDLAIAFRDGFRQVLGAMYVIEPDEETTVVAQGSYPIEAVKQGP